VLADECPVPARGGRPPLTSDAELVALAVAQAAIGLSSDRQFLGLIGRVLPELVSAPAQSVAVRPRAAPARRADVDYQRMTRGKIVESRRPIVAV
jgi:hypothetical protein